MISRRGFLKSIAITAGAGLIAVPAMELIVPPELTIADLHGHVREIAGYAINFDEVVLRWDIRYRRPLESEWVQFHVDSLVRAGDDLKRVRAPIASIMSDRMRMDGVTIHDLLPLPIPAGYQHPEWLISGST